MVHSGDQVTC